MARKRSEPSCLTGYRAIEESLRSGNTGAVLFVSRENSRITDLTALARRQGVRVERTSAGTLSQICSGREHRGAALVFKHVRIGQQAESADLRTILADASDRSGLILVLDRITDPHNLGAILRSADQFGVDCVILPRRRSAETNETVARTSAGASNYVRTIRVPALVRTLASLKAAGYWVYGADVNGEDVSTVSFPPKSVLVMGSEGQGLSDLVRRCCDALVRIPIAGHVDSLNVSVATGILLYEIRRQFRERSHSAGSYGSQ